MRKYVVMGVPGGGKGTQARMLCRDLGLVHISVGAIFRWHVRNHTRLGTRVQRVIAGGGLVDDETVNRVVRERLDQHDWNHGFVIDGFPRNRAQAEFFAERYDVDAVVLLDLPDEEARRRVLARRLCARCGRDHNLVAHPPRTPGRCDACGGELVAREDDAPEAVAARLREHHATVGPVLELLRRKEPVVEVDARPDPVTVQRSIRAALGLPPYEPED